MVEPLTMAIAIGAGAQILSGLAQAYMEHKAQGARAEELAKIKAAFDAVKPPNFDLEVYDDPAMIYQMGSLPEFETQMRPEEMIRQVGMYEPTLPAYVEMAAPQIGMPTAYGEMGREAELDALRRFQEVAKSGYDPILAQKLADIEAKREADAMSMREGALQAFQRRGALDSGMQLAAELAGGESAMMGDAAAARAAAAEQYRNQMRAAETAGTMGRGLRSADIREQQDIANVWNKYNQLSSKRYQDYLNSVAQAQSEGDRYNLGESQRIHEAQAGQQYRNRIEANQTAEWLYKQGRQEEANRLKNTWDRVEAGQAGAQQEYDNIINQLKASFGMEGTVQGANIDQSRALQRGVGAVGDAVTQGAMYYGATAKPSDTAKPPTYSPQSTPTQQQPTDPWFFDDSEEEYYA